MKNMSFQFVPEMKWKPDVAIVNIFLIQRFNTKTYFFLILIFWCDGLFLFQGKIKMSDPSTLWNNQAASASTGGPNLAR
jgi:hypothetical protein